jgi:hypothetical protein
LHPDSIVSMDDQISTPRVTESIKPVAFWMVFIVLLCAALAARLIAVSDSPPLVHNDEAAAAIYIAPPFLTDKPDSPFWGLSSFGQHANFGAWLTAISVRLAGESSLWAIRAGSAVYGTLSIALFALCLRFGFGSLTALLFMLAAIPFHFHVYFSRTGFHYIHAALAMAAVGFLLARFARTPSILNAIVLGIGSGFALMVYSASNVILGALPIALAAIFISPDFRSKFGASWWRKGLYLIAACSIGVLLAMGQHLLFLYRSGFQSRLGTQSIFTPEHLALWKSRLGTDVSQLDVFWQTFLKTLKFFYREDAAGQFGFGGPILEWISATLALVGAVVVIYRVFKFEPISTFIVAMSFGTVLGSAIMVEANFSPHLVAFTLILPALCAIGLGFIIRVSRISSPALVSIIALALALPWSYWNYQELTALNKRRINRDTWVYRLPVDAKSVRSVINVSSLNLDLGESYYKLLYPLAERKQQLGGDPLSEIDRLTSASSCPCVVVFDAAAAEGVKQKLSAPEREARYFTTEKEPTLMAVYIK